MGVIVNYVYFIIYLPRQTGSREIDIFQPTFGTVAAHNFIFQQKVLKSNQMGNWN